MITKVLREGHARVGASREDALAEVLGNLHLLIGLSGQADPGMFSEEVMRVIAPEIVALSVYLAELVAQVDSKVGLESKGGVS